jgi:hypothetical protein
MQAGWTGKLNKKMMRTFFTLDLPTTLQAAKHEREN